MKRRKSTIGQLISTLVFFVMSIWLSYEASNFYEHGLVLKSVLVGGGSVLAFAATFRFQIQKFVQLMAKQK